MTNNCVFCNYDPDKIIRETENTFTILSNPYLLEGHSLVIPKKHYEKIYEIPKNILHELIDEVQHFEEILVNRLNLSGCDIKQNYRPFLQDSKYKVGHLHFHVIPRYFEDELYKKSMIYEKDVFKDMNNLLFKTLMEKLK
jgi:diadenosine tetraphosphate (Ap4A) HIT family hydrolase